MLEQAAIDAWKKDAREMIETAEEKDYRKRWLAMSLMLYAYLAQEELKRQLMADEHRP